MESVPGPLHPRPVERHPVDRKEAARFSPDPHDLPKVAKAVDLTLTEKEDIRKRLPDMRVVLAWLKGIYKKGM